MKKYTALGLMSGTSMDGIDLALISSDGNNLIERGPSKFVAYRDDMRRQISLGLVDAQKISEDRAQRPGGLGHLETKITDLHISAVNTFLNEKEISRTQIDLIGFHGQTVLHRPENGLTVQLGLGEKLAQATGIDVVYDMRENDMKHGGQGAPFVPIYHQALAQNFTSGISKNKPIIFVNIGGISNVTYIGTDGELLAFDSGPGNGLIDQWVSSRSGGAYDEGGNLAKSGEVLNDVCMQYLNHSYFDKPVPKSLDRGDFKPLGDTNISLEDGARTLAFITAKAIINSAKYFPQVPGLWVICGGGVHNRAIMDDLRDMAVQEGSEVVSAEQAGLDAMAIEAEAFAYLAIRSKLGLELTWPNTTGTRKPVTGGVFAKPL